MKGLLRIGLFLLVIVIALVVLDMLRQQPPAPAAVAAAVETSDPFADSNRDVLVLGRAQLRQAARQGCNCGPGCTCTSGECGEAGCPSLRVVWNSKPKRKEAGSTGCCCCGEGCGCNKTYAQGLREARRSRKPLVLWVGCCCPKRVDELREFVHCYSAEIEDKLVPYVAVARWSDYGDGDLTDWIGFRTIPSAEDVRAAVRQPMAARKEESPIVPAPAPASTPAPAPTLTMLPPMPMMPPMMPMGGFGGFGGFGGGCAGGG